MTSMRSSSGKGYNPARPNANHWAVWPTTSLPGPEPAAYNRKVEIETDEQDAKADTATRQMESRLGVKEMPEAQSLGQRYIESARRQGNLTPASSEKTGSPSGRPYRRHQTDEPAERGITRSGPYTPLWWSRAATPESWLPHEVL